MKIKQFPEKISQLPVDFSHPNRALISGLYEESVKVNQAERSFLTYIPEHQEYCRPCVVAAVPSGENPLEYLE